LCKPQKALAAKKVFAAIILCCLAQKQEICHFKRKNWSEKEADWIVTQAGKKQSKRYITVAQRKSGQEKRLAEQLRANLLKRKAQARQRKAAESEGSD